MNATWTASALTAAAPEAVLAGLTDPDAVARWSPVAFELEDDGRLRTGTRTHVGGRLAGVRVGFDVEVHHAGDRQLVLSARGPVRMDVNYDLAPADDGSAGAVHASVSLAKGRGLLAGLLAEAAGLLHTGALSHAVNRMAATA